MGDHQVVMHDVTRISRAETGYVVARGRLLLLLRSPMAQTPHVGGQG